MRSAIIGRRAFALIVCSSASAAPAPAPAPRTQEGRSQKEISAELARLVKEDQEDQAAWTLETDQELIRRQIERRARVMELVGAGRLGSMQDWGHAALLLQHGQTPEDYLLAHVLSVPPGQGDQPFSRFLAAATLDRFLHSVERPQIFTTQSASPTPEEFLPVEPYDASMPESIRSLFGLTPLPRDEGDPPQKKGPSVKELPKLLKLAEQGSSSKDTSATDAKPAEWLVRTRQIVDAGALRSAKELFTAARILSRCADADDLLESHVCAVAACFQGHEEALRLSAETLDRLLLAMGRPQILGTATGDDGRPLQPCAPPLPAVILRGYGLAETDKKKEK